MTAAINPAAPEHLPPFITAPGATDFLAVIMLISVLLGILAIGNIYFRLHSLPENMAHRSNSAQFQLVAVLALLALFTHNNLFWVAALLIAAFEIPDFNTPLTAISTAIDKLSDRIDVSRPSDSGATGTVVAAAAPAPGPEEPAAAPPPPPPHMPDTPGTPGTGA